MVIETVNPQVCAESVVQICRTEDFIHRAVEQVRWLAGLRPLSAQAIEALQRNGSQRFTPKSPRSKNLVIARSLLSGREASPTDCCEPQRSPESGAMGRHT